MHLERTMVKVNIFSCSEDCRSCFWCGHAGRLTGAMIDATHAIVHLCFVQALAASMPAIGEMRFHSLQHLSSWLGHSCGDCFGSAGCPVEACDHTSWSHLCSLLTSFLLCVWMNCLVYSSMVDFDHAVLRVILRAYDVSKQRI